MTSWLEQPLVRVGSRLFVIVWNRGCSSAKPKRLDSLSSLFIKAKEDGSPLRLAICLFTARLPYWPIYSSYHKSLEGVRGDALKGF